MKRLLSCLLFYFHATLAYSASFDLLQVYEEAKQSDPVFQAAIAEYKGVQQKLPIAISAWLPNLRAEGMLSETKSLGGHGIHVSPFTPTGLGYQARLEVTQSIFNLTKVHEIKKAKIAIKKAAADFAKAEQDLIWRVIEAYLDVLEASDILSLTQAEEKATERQLQQATQRFKVGLDPITSVHNAQAAFDAVKAQIITNRYRLENKREGLKTITGRWCQPLKLMKPNLVFNKPSPNNIDAWVQKALQANLELRATRYQIQLAQYELRSINAQHFPTLSGFGRLEESEIKTKQTGSQRTRSLVAGAQLRLSLFEGGGVIWQAKRAKQVLKEGTARLENNHRFVIQQTRQRFNGVLTSISQIYANRQVVRSAQSALHSTEEAVKAGTRTMVNLLAAQSELSDAKQRLAAAQYQYIREFIQLKRLAGILSESDLQQINAWLQ